MKGARATDCSSTQSAAARSTRGRRTRNRTVALALARPRSHSKYNPGWGLELSGNFANQCWVISAAAMIASSAELCLAASAESKGPDQTSPKE